MGMSNGSNGASANQLAELLSQTLLQLNNHEMAPGVRPYDRNETPLGSIVVSGTGLGLPGAEKPVQDTEIRCVISLGITEAFCIATSAALPASAGASRA